MANLKRFQAILSLAGIDFSNLQQRKPQKYERMTIHRRRSNAKAPKLLNKPTIPLNVHVKHQRRRDWKRGIFDYQKRKLKYFDSPGKQKNKFTARLTENKIKREKRETRVGS